MRKYPGKQLAEAAVTPAAHALATRIVQGRLVHACGWWFLRQGCTRAELVEQGIVSRASSYRQEALCEELFGSPVGELTEADIRHWLGQIQG